MAAFWRRDSDQVVQRCWHCNAKLPSTGNLCGRCGATRVHEQHAQRLAIPANGWYSPPDITDVPKRYTSRQTRTDTAVERASASRTLTDPRDAETYVYTPPVFDAEVYAQPVTRPAHQPKEYTGQVYTPPETLYDVPEYTAGEREEPDTSWLARFHD